jgi:hypothetical protein
MSDVDSFEDSAPSEAAITSTVGGLSAGAQAFIRQFQPADDDSGCIATFETVREFKPFKTQQAKAAAEAAGKPFGVTDEVYEDVTYIRINIRGSNLREVHRPIREEDKRRFPFSWQEYQKGEKAAARGTPLNKLAGMDPSILRHYHALNVFTIEDLSLVSDLGLQNLGTGAREFRRSAQEWVESRKPAQAADPQLLDLVSRMDSKLDSQQATIEKLMEENAKLKAAKKPGPKKKAAPATAES